MVQEKLVLFQAEGCELASMRTTLNREVPPYMESDIRVRDATRPRPRGIKFLTDANTILQRIRRDLVDVYTCNREMQFKNWNRMRSLASLTILVRI